MCGVAGVIGWPDRADAERLATRMVASLERRGPDGQGLAAWSDAVLGHRRLAIFDLTEAGAQPMRTRDGALGVVFNGAIYNFLSLRAELTAKGHVFRSRTDTEVLLHGYRAWGVDQLVRRLRGMFAFALWDDRERALFLVRDRLGVKPLVYAVRGHAIAFASTVRAMRAAELTGELDADALAGFLRTGYVAEDRCVFRDVAKLPPASILEWRNGRARTRQYWSPPEPERRTTAFGAVVEEAEARLLEAVRLRLEADVPVGALLSGGIDSALVCWATAKLGGDVTAFTVGTPGDPTDETADATATAREIGIRHRVIELSGEDEPRMDELVTAYAEPFACASALGMLRVCRAVAGEATVLLTGDGGDDVFLGYGRHRYLQRAERLARWTPSALARGWTSLRARIPDVPFAERGLRFLDVAAGGLGAYLGARDAIDPASGWLGDWLTMTMRSSDAPPPSHASARNLLAEYLDHHRREKFVAEYMTKVDGAAMHYALEARSPFLDQEVWALASTLPPSTHLRRGRLKAVLREIARARIGERVARGAKRGFRVPVGRWMAGHWRSNVEAAFRSSLLEREGWIRSAPILAALAGAPGGGLSSNRLWYLYVLESWMGSEMLTGALSSKPARLPASPVAQEA